jgi:hypothetical protein
MTLAQPAKNSSINCLCFPETHVTRDTAIPVGRKPSKPSPRNHLHDGVAPLAERHQGAIALARSLSRGKSANAE